MAEAHNIQYLSIVLHFADGEVEVVGNVADKGTNEGSYDDSMCTIHGAPGGVVLGESDCDVAPDS